MSPKKKCAKFSDGERQQDTQQKDERNDAPKTKGNKNKKQPTKTKYSSLYSSQALSEIFLGQALNRSSLTHTMTICCLLDAVNPTMILLLQQRSSLRVGCCASGFAKDMGDSAKMYRC